MIRIYNSQKGYALILTLILIALVSILGAVMLTTLTTEIRLNKGMEEKAIATYLAQGGVEHGLKVLEATPSDGTPQMPTGVFVVTQQGNNLHEYEILQLTSSVVRVAGRIRQQGNILRQVTLRVEIAEGVITRVVTE